MISICVPIHDIPETPFFLNRLKESLYKQTYQDWELVITKNGKMAENTNSAIKQADGEIIKLLFMDDMLYGEDSLQKIVDAFDSGIDWLATGCVHTEDGVSFYNPHSPIWNEYMKMGINTIGSPSVIAFKNEEPLLFDEKLSWVVDADFYVRMYERYGRPYLIDEPLVAIGVGIHQTTHRLTTKEKEDENAYLLKKHCT